MTLRRYEEGLAAGLSKRDAGLLGAAEDLAQIFREQTEREEAFMADIGYSREELRARPVAERPFINDLFAAWRETLA